MPIKSPPPRVLFVCLGNICRSPLAEGIFRRDAEAAGFEVVIDSAGIGDWHAGQLPDPRAQRIGIALGCKMDMRARQVRSTDFGEFGLIVAMDRSNVQDLLNWPGADRSKVILARSLDETADGLDVPDPYYGGVDGFELVADMLERMSAGLLKRLRSKMSIGAKI